MKQALIAVFALVLAPWTSLHVVAKEPVKPNILLIYSDDPGWADLAAQSVDKDTRTPNLDQLMRDRVRSFAVMSARRSAFLRGPECSRGVTSRSGVSTNPHENKRNAHEVHTRSFQ